MSTDENILRADSIHVGSAGLQIEVRLAWYRSLPLSCVTRIDVALDGEWVAPDLISLEVGGRRYGFGELAQQTEVVWFVQDAATLHLANPGGMRPGDDLEVTIRIDQRIPYILIAPNTALVTSETVSRRLTALPDRAAAR